MEITGEPKLIAAQDMHNAERHVVRLTYVGKAVGELKLDTEEHEDFKWFTRAELEQLNDLDIFFKELLSKNIF